MKILHVVSKDLDATEQKIVDEQSKSNEATVFELKSDKDYDRLVDLIDATEKVVSW